MRRRPWPIVLLAVFQIFIEPWANILISAYFSQLTPTEYLRWFVNHHDWFSLFYLVGLPPLMGITVYAMKWWSYPVFLLSATWMLYENFQGVRVGIHTDWLGPLALYAGNVGFVSYFLLPAVKAPYLNRRMRWWESQTRYLVDYRGEIVSDQLKVECRILDFSEGGVFATCHEPVPMGSAMRLLFETDRGRSYEVQAVPVYCRRDGDWIVGYGMHFVGMDRALRRDLHELALTLGKVDTPVRGGAPDNWGDFKDWWSRLIHTGKGLLPEPERARAAKPAAPTPTEPPPSENTTLH